MPADIDPPVTIPNNESPVPPAVAAAARAAEALHAQVYAPQTAPAAPQPPQSQAPATGAPQPPARTEVPETGGNGSWEHRYLAMKGRYDQQAQDVGQMQQLLQDMSGELAQTRALLRPNPTPAAPQRRLPPKAITAEDEQKYGPELLSLIQRAARDVVAPALDKVSRQTEALKTNFIDPLQAQVAHTSSLTIYQVLDQSLPEWRTVNVDPRFKAWMRLQDVYSGVVRETLLQDAFQAADAPRVLSFFKGFLLEEQVTGQRPVLPQDQPATLPPQPAVDPLMLAVPGRHKPAGSEPPLSADKPVYARSQISKFYDDVRRGVYIGHDQLRMNTEASIFAAQNEGRIR